MRTGDNFLQIVAFAMMLFVAGWTLVVASQRGRRIRI